MATVIMVSFRLTSSQRTRELLGWQPNQPGLIPELDRPRYFET
jgi:hypothetical protein